MNTIGRVASIQSHSTEAPDEYEISSTIKEVSYGYLPPLKYPMSITVWGDQQLPVKSGSQSFWTGEHWARRETIVGMMTAVANPMTAYRPHLHTVFVRKMRKRNRHIDNLVQRPEKMPIGAAIELHFKDVVMSRTASSFVE